MVVIECVNACTFGFHSPPLRISDDIEPRWRYLHIYLTVVWLESIGGSQLNILVICVISITICLAHMIDNYIEVTVILV